MLLILQLVVVGSPLLYSMLRDKRRAWRVTDHDEKKN